MAIAYNRYADSNIPITYWSIGMSNFAGPPSLLEFYNEFNLKSVYNNGNSFFLAGTHGVGKTLTSANILKTACLKNYVCLYTTLSDVISALIDSPLEEKFLTRKELVGVDFLIMDEVDGRFFQSESSSDLFGKMLEQIFRTRLQNKLPTILCSNSPNPLEMFSGAMKTSLESLCSSSKTIIAIGKDFRKHNEKM